MLQSVYSLTSGDKLEDRRLLFSWIFVENRTGFDLGLAVLEAYLPSNSFGTDTEALTLTTKGPRLMSYK